MLTWEYRSMIAMGKPISLGPSPSEIADFIDIPPGSVIDYPNEVEVVTSFGSGNFRSKE